MLHPAFGAGVVRFRGHSCYFRTLAPAVAIFCTTSAIAAAIALFVGLRLEQVIQDYLVAAIAATLNVIIIWFLLTAIRTERSKLRYSTFRLLKRLRIRWPLLLLPAVLSPLFLAAYTTAKTGIPFLVGFHWDAILADVDRVIFRVDPWQITHGLLGEHAVQLLAKVYSVIWLVLLPLVQGFVALYGRARFVAIFSSTMMFTWLLGGVAFAYLFSSAGPALAYAVDPDVGNQFADLGSALSRSTPAAGIGLVQQYLVHSLYQPLVTSGGGVSAMPSMHVATATVYILAARGTRWFWPATAFAMVIWIGSVHFGFHYAVDGPAAVVVAWGCWCAMTRLQDWLERASEKRSRPSPIFVDCPQPLRLIDEDVEGIDDTAGRTAERPI